MEVTKGIPNFLSNMYRQNGASLTWVRTKRDYQIDYFLIPYESNSNVLSILSIIY